MASLPLVVNWNIDPVFFPIGSLDIRYYGVSWMLALFASMLLFMNFVKREGYSEKIFDSIFWYAVLSTIIGARLGHCLFYDPLHYLTHPIELFYFREGGLASHGAAIGLLVGLWMFSRKKRMPYIWSLDRIMVAVAISGTLVRLGNLMNSEIYGVETTLPWGFIFARNGETLPKHPTQIYEALCYFVLFIVLMWLYYGRDLARRRPGLLFGIGLEGIFVPRFFIEYIKNPQEAFEQGMSLYMGQWLSIPFIVLGIVVIFKALQKPELVPQPLDKIKKKIPAPDNTKKKR